MRLTETVDNVGQLGFFGGMIGVDDVPEGCGLARRCLGVEVGDVQGAQVSSDIGEAAVLVPFPDAVPVFV